MSLNEEIALYQFAQGVHPEVALLDRFSQLEENKQINQLFEINFLVRELKPIDADVQQAMTESALTDADIARVFPNSKPFRIAVHPILQFPKSDYELAHKFLLFLFKAAYQRRAALGNPANWRYWNLSSPDVIQDIRTRHQQAFEQVYANPSFRSEFASIAKLWYERRMLQQAKRQESIPEPDNHFTFLSYDEMLTESIKAFSDKQMQGIRLLSHSLEKALSVQYGFDADEVKRVIDDVIKRHLRDTYQTDLFD